MGFRDWVAAAFIDVVLVTTELYTAWMVKTKRTGPRYMRVALGLNFLLVGGFASFVGPLFVVPAVAIMMGATMIVSLRANRPTRALVTGGAMATVLVPLALEWTGVLPPSYVFEDGVIKVLPRIADFPPTATLLALIGSALAPILLTGLLVGRSTDALLKAERKNFAQAYRLKQLLPPGAAEEPPKSSEAAPWCESLGGVRRAARVGKRST